MDFGTQSRGFVEARMGYFEAGKDLRVPKYCLQELGMFLPGLL